MQFPRQTLRSEAVFEGFGLHSGEPTKVSVRPGSRGIWFRNGKDEIRAAPENVTDTRRRTKLGSVSTIEHLMSAFAGLEITDAEVEVNSNELPGLDGSARAFAEGLKDAGLQKIGELEVEGPYPRLYVRDEDSKIAVSAGEGHWRYRFTSPEHWPFDLFAESKNVPLDYLSSIAPARTWCFEEDLPKLRAERLGCGLGWGSVIIIGANGYVNEARSPDEPARHKLLDLIGDLYLSGVPVRALNVSAIKSGHRSHLQAARLLSEHVRVVSS
jgi:UDP-3-O-[3-hydroxymyristoyl] N-acetylglucosamine deacetylase